MFKKGRWMGLKLYSPNNAQKNFLLYTRRPPGYHWRNTPKNLPHCTALTALQPIYTVHQESVGQLSNWCERMWAFWDKADLQAMAACSAVHSSMLACAQRLKQLVHVTEMGNRKKPTALCFRRKKKCWKSSRIPCFQGILKATPGCSCQEVLADHRSFQHSSSWMPRHQNATQHCTTSSPAPSRTSGTEEKSTQLHEFLQCHKLTLMKAFSQATS